MVTLNIKSVTSMPPEAAIGQQAGSINQGSLGVAVGKQAGYQNQGANAVAIGAYAGFSDQTAGSIVLNASGSAVNATTPGFYVNPVRSVTTSSTGVVSYSANEMTLTSNIIMNTVTATTFVGNGSQLSGIVLNNASSLTQGTLNANIFPQTIGNGSTIYQGNGSLLTGVSVSNASSLTQGTLSQTIFPTTIGNASTTLTGNALTFGNASVQLYVSNNILTSSTNLQTPAGISMAMNTAVSAGGHSVYIHPMACAWFFGSAPGVVTTAWPGGYLHNATFSGWYWYGQYNVCRTYINLSAGIYRFVYQYVKMTDGGIVTINLNDVTISTVDTYLNSAQGQPYTHVETNITVASSGVHKLEFQTNSKNASATTQYMHIFTAAVFVRTG